MKRRTIICLLAVMATGGAAIHGAQDTSQQNPSVTMHTVKRQLKGATAGQSQNSERSRTSGAQSQAPALPGSNESLGVLARQLKKAQAQQGVKPAKVYTNDNIPKAAEIGSATSSALPPEKAAAAKGKTAAAAPGAAGKHGEQYFRSKMADLRAQLGLHQRELAVLQQKLSQTQLENYSNPQKTLEEESTPKFYADQQKIKNEISKKQAQIDADNQAIEDLRDELRRAGGDPGWIR